ncbi:Laccase-4 [Portunus trituberculatus]|uniref:Laccase-4 n=1 Tax=Portunus trituberculatus TaxID=210409 RepID=A0A5B7FGF1_PORTR|nr:Laccase-4 [Portunus trituberculatus]
MCTSHVLLAAGNCGPAHTTRHKRLTRRGDASVTCLLHCTSRSMAHLCPPPQRLPPLLLLLLLVNSALADGRHECERPCVEGETRTCYYHFHAQQYYTMSRACYSCPDNLDDCSREECIVADGTSIPVLAINRQMPGPSIQVCEGDHVVIDLENGYISDTEALHFHGMAMTGYQYYDGVPFLTQCPVLPSTFRYQFLATCIGTYLWHSHVGVHRVSIFGSIVVRLPEDPHRGLYDQDLYEHVLVLSDWDHTPVETTFWGNHHVGNFAFPKNILINGKGRDPNSEVLLPLEVVRVKPGLRYRMRFIDGGGGDCPMIVSVDGHRMTIIGMDGTSSAPFTVDSFIMLSDGCYVTDRKVFNGRQMGGSIVQAKQGAILRYEGAPEEDPTETFEYDPNPIGVTVNPLKPDPYAPNLVSMVSMSSLQPFVLDEKVDKKFYLAFNFNAVNATPFFNPELYPYNRVPPKFQIPTPQVNGITFIYPPSPPLSQPDDPQPTVCLYGEAELGDKVEFVLIDEGNFINSSHPFHLHGKNFRVVAMGQLGDQTSVAEVQALDEAGHIKRRYEDAVEKDTVNIPHGGYTIVRFTADNPGWWAMHCHLVDHSEMGMVGVLHVGTREDVPPVPKGFPTCGHFVP